MGNATSCADRASSEPRATFARMRKVILKTVVGLANLTAGTKMTDAHNGLRALSRKGRIVSEQHLSSRHGARL